MKKLFLSSEHLLKWGKLQIHKLAIKKKLHTIFLSYETYIQLLWAS